MEASWLVLAAFLYLVSAGLLIVEVFVPSGGIISIFSLISLISGLTIFFKYSATAGLIGVILALVMIPAVLILAYKMFPKSRFGKAVTLEPPVRDKGDAIPDTEDIVELVGKVGKVISPLRPVGMCEIEGRRIECVAEHGYVEKECKVKVIKVEGTQLTVRKVGGEQ